MKKILTIKGMHCNACKELIEDIAKETKGVNACIVDVKKGTADMTYENPEVLSTLKKELEKQTDYRIA